MEIETKKPLRTEPRFINQWLMRAWQQLDSIAGFHFLPESAFDGGELFVKISVYGEEHVNPVTGDDETVAYENAITFGIRQTAPNATKVRGQCQKEFDAVFESLWSRMLQEFNGQAVETTGGEAWQSSPRHFTDEWKLKCNDVAAFQRELENFASKYREAGLQSIYIGEWQAPGFSPTLFETNQVVDVFLGKIDPPRSLGSRPIDETGKRIDPTMGRSFGVTFKWQSKEKEWLSVSDMGAQFAVSMIGGEYPMLLKVDSVMDTALLFVRAWIERCKSLWEARLLATHPAETSADNGQQGMRGDQMTIRLRANNTTIERVAAFIWDFSTEYQRADHQISVEKAIGGDGTFFDLYFYLRRALTDEEKIARGIPAHVQNAETFDNQECGTIRIKPGIAIGQVVLECDPLTNAAKQFVNALADRLRADQQDAQRAGMSVYNDADVNEIADYNVIVDSATLAEMFQTEEEWKANTEQISELTQDEIEIIAAYREAQKQDAELVIRLGDESIRNIQRPKLITFQEADQFITMTFEDMGNAYGDFQRHEIAPGLVKYSLSYRGITYVRVIANDGGNRGIGLRFMEISWPPLKQVFFDIGQWVYARIEDYCFFTPEGTGKTNELRSESIKIGLLPKPPKPTFGPQAPATERVSVVILEQIIGEPAEKLIIGIDASKLSEDTKPEAVQSVLASASDGQGLPSSTERKAILDAVDRANKKARGLVPKWELIRDELSYIDPTENKEAPSVPTLRRKIRAMWNDETTRDEIKTHGLYDVIEELATRKRK